MNAAEHKILKTSDWKNGIELENQKCEIYNDCFNCVLARCLWNSGKCTIDSKYSEKTLFLNHFMSEAT